MDDRARLTPLGKGLLVVLVACVVAVFVGSRGLQTAGFVVGLIVLLVIAGDQLPRMRVGGGSGGAGPMPRLRAPRRDSAHDPADDA